jgi:hypothetical protein
MLAKKIVYYSFLSCLIVSIFVMSVSFNSNLDLLKFAKAADPIPTAPDAGSTELPPAPTSTTNPTINTNSGTTVVDGVNPGVPNTPDAGSSGGVSTKKPPVIPTETIPVTPDNNWQLKNPTKQVDSPSLPENPTPETPSTQTNQNTTATTQTSKPNNTPRSGGLETGVAISLLTLGGGIWYYYKKQHGQKNSLSIVEKKLR